MLNSQVTDSYLQEEFDEGRRILRTRVECEEVNEVAFRGAKISEQIGPSDLF
jgi:hypothetical protein